MILETTTYKGHIGESAVCVVTSMGVTFYIRETGEIYISKGGNMKVFAFSDIQELKEIIRLYEGMHK